MIFVIDLKERIETIKPTFFNFGFGNLYSAFRSAQWIKTITLKLKLQWEAVFLTQIRSLSDERVLSFRLHNLDDGEVLRS
jgi:hypothetical protein